MTEQTKENVVEMAETRTPTEIKRDPIIVQDQRAMLDTGRFEAMQRVANAMASARLVPKHLQGSPADCLLVVNQAVKRGMDPLDLAQHTFVVSGKLGYEGKVVAAWVNSAPDVDGRLRYEYDGEGEKRRVKVIGKLIGEDNPRTIEGTVADWKTSNENWKKNPDSMLAYRGAREWARRHVPDLLLGVYTPDELGEEPPAMKDITPARPTRAAYEYKELPKAETVDPETGEVTEETAAEAETDGGGEAEPEEQKGEAVVGEAEGDAAPAAESSGQVRGSGNGNGDPRKWKAKQWSDWARQALDDIDSFDDPDELDEYYQTRLHMLARLNLDMHRNEGAEVENRYNERLRALQGETAGPDA